MTYVSTLNSPVRFQVRQDIDRYGQLKLFYIPCKLFVPYKDSIPSKSIVLNSRCFFSRKRICAFSHASEKLCMNQDCSFLSIKKFVKYLK